ncbi:hypothetical protein SDJN03_08959, partial [Cucurbita argyrosperma subsp. sororia]
MRTNLRRTNQWRLSHMFASRRIWLWLSMVRSWIFSQRPKSLVSSNEARKILIRSSVRFCFLKCQPFFSGQFNGV